MRPSAPRSPWLLAALLALPAYLEPVVRLGAVHPDEIFQAIEPAFTQVHGRGYVPWEWKVGLRNEAVVGLLAALYRAARQGIFWPWDLTSEHVWEARIRSADLFGASSTQITTITIPTTDFVTGRITTTISGGPLSSPVVIRSDAAVGDTEEDLGTQHASDIDDLIATTLATAVASVTNDVTNEVVIVFIAGIGRMTVSSVYMPAQQTTITWGGTLVDGEYSVRVVCDDPKADTTIDNDRSSGTPANVNAMAAAFEAAAEALIGGDLADVLVSADDAGAVNTMIFEPGVVATVTATATSKGFKTVPYPSPLKGGGNAIRKL